MCIRDSVKCANYQAFVEYLTIRFFIKRPNPLEIVVLEDSGTNCYEPQYIKLLQKVKKSNALVQGETNYGSKFGTAKSLCKHGKTLFTYSNKSQSKNSLETRRDISNLLYISN